MGVDIKAGATGEVAEKAKEAFVGRTLSDYYTEGKLLHHVFLARIPLH